MNIKEILLAAADRIETGGWFANPWNTPERTKADTIYEPKGNRGECAWLAISVASDKEDDEPACEAVCKYLGLPLEGGGWAHTLIYWNNRQTSRDVVLAALRGAAESL